MAFPEYQLRGYLHAGWIREKDDRTKWIFRNKTQENSVLSLEEEIYHLRCRLEELVLNGNSLSSPEVVKVSTLLDKKINEYMEQSRQN